MIMKTARMILLVVAILIDLGIAVFAIAFSNASVAVRTVVAGVMVAAIGYEIYDARKSILKQEKEKQQKKVA